MARNVVRQSQLTSRHRGLEPRADHMTVGTFAPSIVIVVPVR